ncbi:MAG: sigma-70 family RNA polymerase sigma factor [Planctomycetales bacterium]|nr:sigma-70 family RNA polymerase sigma factor [Planctomycetales bacterium]
MLRTIVAAAHFRTGEGAHATDDLCGCSLRPPTFLADVRAAKNYNVGMNRFTPDNSQQPDTPPAAGELPSLSTSLLQRVQAMQPDAWARLVQVFSPIVYRWCRQWGLTSHDSADVVQEVFVSVARGIGRFERQAEQGSFRTWLATICRNRIRDHWRRAGRGPQAAGGTAALRDLQNLEELELSITETQLTGLLPARLLAMIEAEFEPHTWQAFWRTTIDGQSPREVADQLGIQVATVYQAKSRVLRKLRQRLDELPR